MTEYTLLGAIPGSTVEAKTNVEYGYLLTEFDNIKNLGISCSQKITRLIFRTERIQQSKC